MSMSTRGTCGRPLWKYSGFLTCSIWLPLCQYFSMYGPVPTGSLAKRPPCFLTHSFGTTDANGMAMTFWNAMSGEVSRNSIVHLPLTVIPLMCFAFLDQKAEVPERGLQKPLLNIG